MKKTLLDYTLKIRLPITIFVVVVSFVLTYYVSRAERDGVGYKPDQPIAFSHKLHAGTMKIDCQYCHTSVTKSRYASIPSVSICMSCHSVARKDKPEIVKLTKYYNWNEIIPWKRIHIIPDYAYFNHSVHVNKGLDCAECHGPVQEMDIVKQVNSWTMTACLKCHREADKKYSQLIGVKRGPENCFACHR
ncbi:MAG: cytochrome c family protein [Ignavibacteria bacterium]|nr:cytochrome c family protein [Ignavibacteria bacterium]